MAITGPNNIGEAQVVFTGDVTPLRVSAAEAQAIISGSAVQMSSDVRAFADSAKESYRRTAEHAKTLTDANEKQGMSFMRARAALAGYIALIYGGTRAVLGLTQAYEDAEGAAGKFIKGLSSDAPQKALDQIQAKVEELSGAASGSGFAALGDQIKGIFGFKTAATQIEELTAVANVFAKKRDADRAKSETDATAQTKQEEEKRHAHTLALANERSKMLDDMYEQQVTKRLDGEERINYETETSVRRLDELKKNASEEDLRRIMAIEAEIRDEQKRRIDEYRKGMEDAAKEIGRQIKAAISDVQRDAANLFRTGDIAVQIGELRNIVQQIADGQRNLY